MIGNKTFISGLLTVLRRPVYASGHYVPLKCGQQLFLPPHVKFGRRCKIYS